MAGWFGEVAVKPVCSAAGNVLHTYFSVCPESPDGRRLVAFVSSAADAHRGDICLIDRDGGAMQSLVQGVEVEDAHRQACQQWAGGGRFVVFHQLRDGCSVACRADVQTGEVTELAQRRQVGWCADAGEVVPLYGQHWVPGRYRDLELLDLTTGELRTALTLREVLAKRRPWARRLLEGRPGSIFFPTLSPDGTRVLFKLAAPLIPDPRAGGASHRRGLLVYDLATREELLSADGWGHPAWFPDSRRIINAPNAIFDVETREQVELTALPAWPGMHPSISPDGRLMVADTTSAAAGGSLPWGVVVADLETQRWRTLFASDLPRNGTTSWRPAHPHPIFSRDGSRVYFNVNLGDRTVLHVARPVEDEEPRP